MHIKIKLRFLLFVTALFSMLVFSNNAFAENRGPNCNGLPLHSELTQALRANVAATSDTDNGGLGNNMWATLVNRDGVVCAVTFSGNDRDDQ